MYDAAHISSNNEIHCEPFKMLQRQNLPAVNRIPGKSPVWQRPLNEISGYFRDLELVTHANGVSRCFQRLVPLKRLRGNVGKEESLQAQERYEAEEGESHSEHAYHVWTLTVHVSLKLLMKWERDGVFQEPSGTGVRPSSTTPNTFCTFTVKFISSARSSEENECIHFESA